MAVHPFPLNLFLQGLQHLNRLKTATANLKKTENNQIAVFALSNLMDDAGLDFALFTTALQTAKDLVRNSGENGFILFCTPRMYSSHSRNSEPQGALPTVAILTQNN